MSEQKERKKERGFRSVRQSRALKCPPQMSSRGGGLQFHEEPTAREGAPVLSPATVHPAYEATWI